MPNEGATVVLDDGRELGGRKPAVADPAWELVVPHAVMPAKQLSVRLSEVRDLVAARERERSLLRLSSILSTALNKPIAQRMSWSARRTHFMLFAGVICPNSLVLSRISV